MRTVQVILVLTGLATVSALFGDAAAQLTCPTRTTCPTGYTGSVCEYPLCTQRGTVLPPEFKGTYSIDIDLLASCNNAYILPIDSHVKSFLVLVIGYNNNLHPKVTVYDPFGRNITNNMEVTSSGKIWTGSLQQIDPNSGFGSYSVVITSTGGPCGYDASAQTDLTLSLGYVYGNNYQINDNPSTKLPENTMGGIAAHVNNLVRPGFSAGISVYMAPGNVSQLVAQYPVVERFNCANDVYAGPVICTTDAYYSFKLNGIDEHGFSFMRTNYLLCTGNVVSTTAPTTTTSMCLNGGYYNPATQQCECGFYWEGTICQQPVCFNGGTPIQNGCVCPKGYVDQNCIEAGCSSPNSALQPYSANGRTLIIIVQNTQSMASTIAVFADYVSELYYDFQLQYSNYILNYILVEFNPNGAKVLVNTNNPQTLFEAVWHLNDTLSHSSACKQQFNPAVKMALLQTNPPVQMYSDIYVFTNSPADSSNPSNNLHLYDQLESSKSTLMFFIEQPKNGFCAEYSGSEFDYYRNLAQFTGGLAMLLQQGPNNVQNMRLIPTSYQRQQIYQKSFTDCTNPYGVDIFIPVDSHAGSLSVSVQGNLPNVDIYRPDGSLFSAIALLDNYYTAVRQVISPCPKHWEQRDNKCFSGQYNPTSWFNANVKCQAMGGALMTVLNQERQDLIDRNSGGISFWLSLNELTPLTPNSFSNYTWKVGNESIPLGDHYVNWAPGYPTNDPNAQCVAMKYVNGGRGHWYNINCNTQLEFLCEIHTFDNESPDFPPGIYRINFQTHNPQSNDTTGAYNKNCLVTVNAQSDMQLFYGYNTGSDSLSNDFPAYEPSSQSSTNRFVANFTNLDESLSSVNMLEFYDDNYNLLQAQWMTHRTSPCAYRYVSDMFTCPQKTFATVITGTDDRGFTFNRYQYGVCLGTSERNE